MTGFQVLGAYAAAEIVKEYSARWGDAGLYSIADPKSVNGTIKKIGVLYGPPADSFYGYMLFEEFCAVLILLIGLLHLMGALTPGNLKNTYWEEAAEQTAPASSEIMTVSGGGGFSTKVDDIQADVKKVAEGVIKAIGLCEALGKMPTRDSSVVVNNVAKVDNGVDNNASTAPTARIVVAGARKTTLFPLPPLRVPMKSSTTPSTTSATSGMFDQNFNIDSFFIGGESPDLVALAEVAKPAVAVPNSAYIPKPSLKIHPIPVDLILHASLLVFAISRAFPSAHQSLHITSYLRIRGFIDDNEATERVAGGYLGCVAALMYYWFWYVYAGNVRGAAKSADDKAESWIKRNFMDPTPAFLRGELRLPGYMRMDDVMM